MVVRHRTAESDCKRCRQTTDLRGNAMKRALAILLTSLLFSAALTPHAMAQKQKTSIPLGLALSSASIPKQAAADTTQPTDTKSDIVPEAPTSPTPNVSPVNSERSRPKVDRPKVDDSYPAYCPPLPRGTIPGDWDYREALEKCLYGT
jgi:hypothetical protein